MPDPVPATAGLRADARKNHERILDATRLVIAQIGPGFGLTDVAAQAGVAMSTIYRRFTGRQDLVRAVFERYVAEEVEPSVTLAVADPHPWSALVKGMEVTVMTVVENAALLEAARDSAIITYSAAAGVVRPLGPALRRAQESGDVRHDVDPDDLPALITMVVSTMLELPTLDNGGYAEWRRYLTVVLEGIRARESNHPLPTRIRTAPPPTAEAMPAG